MPFHPVELIHFRLIWTKFKMDMLSLNLKGIPYFWKYTYPCMCVLIMWISVLLVAGQFWQGWYLLHLVQPTSMARTFALIWTTFALSLACAHSTMSCLEGKLELLPCYYLCSYFSGYKVSNTRNQIWLQLALYQHCQYHKFPMLLWYFVPWP